MFMHVMDIISIEMGSTHGYLSFVPEHFTPIFSKASPNFFYFAFCAMFIHVMDIISIEMGSIDVYLCFVPYHFVTFVMSQKSRS